MEFKQIEAFITVARFKSFSKAADTIFLSQPTISAHISSLEKELKVVLFERASREVKLTSAGEVFLEYALDIMSTRNKAIQNLKNYSCSVFGKLHLSVSTTAAHCLLPELITHFYKRYPGVVFSIMEKSSGEIVEDILKFNCELGVVGREVSDERILCKSLIRDNLVVISPPWFNLAENVELKELLNYPFIMREVNSATRKVFESLLLEQDLSDKLKLCCEINSLDAQLQLVKTGLGISVVSERVCDDLAQLGKLRISSIKDFNASRNLYLLTSSKRSLTPTAQAFYDLCKEKFHFIDNL